MLTQLEEHDESSLNVPMSLPWFPCEPQSPQPGVCVCVCERGRTMILASLPGIFCLIVTTPHYRKLPKALLQACFQIPL